MAKKDTENFDFETESEGKGKFDIVGFFKNLTKQQKGIILIAAVAIILVIAIVIALVIIGANNNSENSGNPDDPSSDEGISYEIINISVFSEPTKTVYYVGEYADYSGFVLMLELSNNGPEDFDYYSSNPEKFTFDGFDSSAPVESQTITVGYEGFTTSFDIKIIEVPKAPAALKSIRLDPNNMPADTCKWGYAPDIRGAKLVCEYSDGTTKVIDLAYEHLNDYEEDLMAAQVGDTVTIPVVYDEDGVIVGTSFTVTITE